jgi:phosphopantothenoylcysteine synthetase/decarboxylase
MSKPNPVYLMISGAATAHRAGELIAGLSASFDPIFVLQTPNAHRVISPRDLARIPGAQVIESYFDARILPRPMPGTVLFAPCNFNSLNKLAAGIADSLALSITAEMIGFGQKVVVALSLNEPLFAHPIVRQSIATLTRWGVTVVEPQDAGQGLMMAPSDVVLSSLQPMA